MLRKNNFIFSLYISLSPILLLGGVLSYFLAGELTGLLITFFTFFLVTILYAITYFGFLALYSIYLYTSAFFMYDCLFLTLFTKKNFLIQTYPTLYNFKQEIGFIFIICCFFMVFFGHISYIYFRGRIKTKHYNIQKRNYEMIGSKLFFLSIIPVCYKIFLQLQYVMSNGYFSIYSEGFSNIKYPFWCSGAYLIFNAAFYFILASNPSKKKVLLYFFVYFIVSVFESLKGGRGTLIAFIVVLVFLLKNKYDYGINIKHLIFVFCLIIFLTSTLGTLRDSYGNSNASVRKKKIDIAGVLEDVLWSQTTSRAVPLLIIRGDLKYHPYPFIFYPFTNRVLPYIYHANGNDIDSLLHYNNPSQVLMGNISVWASLSGMGYGSAAIGEAYECGKYLGVIFFSSLISLLIAFIDVSKLKVKNIMIPFWYVVLTTVPGIPRKEIFQFVIYNLNFVVFFYLLFMLFEFLFFRGLKDGR